MAHAAGLLGGGEDVYSWLFDPHIDLLCMGMFAMCYLSPHMQLPLPTGSLQALPYRTTLASCGVCSIWWIQVRWVNKNPYCDITGGKQCVYHEESRCKGRC